MFLTHLEFENFQFCLLYTFAAKRVNNGTMKYSMCVCIAPYVLYTYSTMGVYVCYFDIAKAICLFNNRPRKKFHAALETGLGSLHIHGFEIRVSQNNKNKIIIVNNTISLMHARYVSECRRADCKNKTLRRKMSFLKKLEYLLCSNG